MVGICASRDRCEEWGGDELRLFLRDVGDARVMPGETKR
jgi:hypothetical protein